MWFRLSEERSKLIFMTEKVVLIYQVLKARLQ